jgi:ABC-type hemin transport system substrate-binding protein
VWVTDPRSVIGAVALLGELADLGAPAAARARVIDPIHAALARAAARRAAPPARVFCPIWKRPWMAVGRDTYADDLLRVCGGQNVFADRPERRYPIVEEAEIVAAAPEVILLPDEPYAFGPRDSAELSPGRSRPCCRCWLRPDRPRMGSPRGAFDQVLPIRCR